MQTITAFRYSPGNSRINEPVLTGRSLKTLDDVSKLLPQGAYTTFRTFNHTGILRFSDHIKRLEDAARLSGYPVKVDWQGVRDALRQVISQSTIPELRVRLTLDLKQQAGTVYFSLEPLTQPSEVEYQRGVKAMTRRLHRKNPRAKLTSFLQTAANTRVDVPPDVNEVIMVSESGGLLEGLSSNFFCVVAAEIWTSEEGILPGITRTLVLQEINRAGIPLHMQSFSSEDLSRIDEAFITSTSRSVLPVVQLDDRVIGDGNPGPITRRLMQAYMKRIAEEVEPI